MTISHPNFFLTHLFFGFHSTVSPTAIIEFSPPHLDSFNATFIQVDPSTFRTIVQKLTKALNNSFAQKLLITHPLHNMGPEQPIFKLHEWRQTIQKLEIKLNRSQNNDNVHTNGNYVARKSFPCVVGFNPRVSLAWEPEIAKVGGARMRQSEGAMRGKKKRKLLRRKDLICILSDLPRDGNVRRCCSINYETSWFNGNGKIRRINNINGWIDSQLVAHHNIKSDVM